MSRFILVASVLMMGLTNLCYGQDSLRTEFVVEEKATYKGGEAAMYKFISEKFVIPDRYYELKGGVELTILVSFVVGKDGCLETIEVVNASKVPQDMQDAAIKVFKKMGCKRWSPATQRGKPVRMRFRIPVRVSIPG